MVISLGTHARTRTCARTRARTHTMMGSEFVVKRESKKNGLQCVLKTHAFIHRNTHAFTQKHTRIYIHA